MASKRTVPMRLPADVVAQAKLFGALHRPPKTPGEMLEIAWLARREAR